MVAYGRPCHHVSHDHRSLSWGGGARFWIFHFFACANVCPPHRLHRMSGHLGVPVCPTLIAETNKYTLEHREAKVCFVGKLNKGLLEQIQKSVSEGLKCISFLLCQAYLTYDMWASPRVSC